MLYLGPYAMILTIIFKWIGKLPNTYLWNTGAGSAASLVDFVGTPLILWLSEPSRLGRKGAYLVLCLCAATTLGAAWLSGGGDLKTAAYINLGLKIVLSFVGGGNPQGANYAILCAYFVDEAPAHQHVAGFSILLGAQFLAMCVFPGMAIALQPALGEQGLLFLGFILSVVQLPFVVMFFPRGMPQPQAAAIADPFDTTSTPSSTGALASRGAFGDICKALRWIFRERMAATVVWMSIAFVGAADSSNIMLFLGTGLHWTPTQVNVVVGSIGFFGALLSLVIVPWISQYVSKSFLVFISTLATIGHCLTYGLLTSVVAITALGFLGAATYAAFPPLLAYMDKENDSGLPHGVLVGAFCGLKSLATILGPPVLAACLQADKDGDKICYFMPGTNWAGSGFVLCAVLMVPAVLASIRLLLQGRQEKRSVGYPSQECFTVD